ncbi:GNAT family N-acetyltransferase [Amycolatopsis sp. NBC_01480]|uniref:GNAT family N-acetyltransferase n=1 Tax=Amycolatopsis sp. NBC_01480 TaxID=2903562 RepID=UPI002E2D7637|nr:GNAT family N-acetyltransferase [Amycolatopsis sp. NBC_01480]
MRPETCHLTENLGDFFVRAEGFLHSRPALHNTPLTVLEKLRKLPGGEAIVFGWMERGGEVCATFYLRQSARLSVTPLSAGQAEVLAAYLAGLGRSLAGVTAEHDTAAAFAEAWHQRTNAAPTLTQPLHLYRLGTLTPPEPRPAGRGRAVGEPDRAQLIRMCSEFVTAVGEVPAVDADSWASSRFADRHFTFWEAPDGTPVSMAARTSMIAGMVRIDPVYTPARLRGHGYAGAVTVEASRAALAAGAKDVVLYTDPANRTSNALYQRIGYVRITDFAVYDFA